MKKPELVLIDGTAFCYRAFYGVRDLSTSFGQPTNAVFGFINIVRKLFKDKAPVYAAVCFDVSKETFRQKKFVEYKINRPPMPDGLVSQIPLIKEFVAAYGFPIFEKEGFEADDVISEFARKARGEHMAVTIITSDKDMLQLVGEDVEVLNPYKDDGLVYTVEKVVERFGVEPSKISDVIALMGDDADNIPGVPGIGEKTAVGLIKKFGTIEGLLSKHSEIKEERIRRSIEEHKDRILLNKELVVLNAPLDINFNLESLRVKDRDVQKLFTLFRKLEFKSFLKDLPVEKAAGADARIIPDDELPQILGRHHEITVAGNSFANIVFGIAGNAVQAAVPGVNVKKILSDPDIKKTGHDLKRIKVALKKEGVVFSGLYFDTMIAAYLLNPSRISPVVSDCAWDYLGESVREESLVPASEAVLVDRLKQKLEAALRDKELYGLFSEIEMPLVDVLAEMEITGICLDTGFLADLSLELGKKISGLMVDIYREAGGEFNINSPKQLSDVLFARLQLPVIKKTKTGASTDEEVLRTLASKHALPALILEYRQLNKLKSTYIDPLPACVDPATGRIHTSFNQAGTETGRLSSSNPNLQNLPIKTATGKSIRKAIVSFNEHCTLVACDYSQIELRILAHMSGDTQLIDAFKKDLDIHKATAAFIHGVEEKSVTSDMRDVAKRVNFGITYGLTSFGLARDIGVSFDDAQAIIDTYFTRYPQVKAYIQEQIHKAEKDGFVTTILGRRRYIPDIGSKNQGIRQLAQRQAVNTPIQGSASDLIKAAMVKIHAEFIKRKVKTEMILQIHDELLFNVPKPELKDVVPLVKEIMEHVWSLDVPIKIDIEAGKNWLEMEKVSP